MAPSTRRERVHTLAMVDGTIRTARTRSATSVSATPMASPATVPSVPAATTIVSGRGTSPRRTCSASSSAPPT
jgi:hypothetical protein